MSDERETQPEPGAAVEEQAVAETAVQDAVDRAQAIVEEAQLGAEPVAAAGASESAAESAAEAVAAAEAAGSVAVEAGTEAVNTAAAAAAAQEAADAAAAEYARQAQVASIDTELDIESLPVAAPEIALADLPSAAAEPAPIVPPARDGEIRISSDHPMAALYMQTPMPPDLKGNRGAGVLIALLATLAFAVLYAGLIAIMLAPSFPPSTFLTEGLLPWVMSWGFISGVAAFFVGLTALVLIFGRAGWWAYVLFSFFVGVLVWGVATAVFALTGDPNSSAAAYAKLVGQPAGEFRTTLVIGKLIAFGLPTLGAGILAREVAVWFGAWIGARGRKVTAKNALLLAEYEEALSEAKAQA